ncbi:hypothetical protein B0A54_08766 [Friedmanniomyces endolithicus]|uniref:IBR domain-containing protein n=1 Tax=Friedmanniomyces endolithicus TaxID=329885 RepID=A0A4U0UTG6_9PEZI|nr:hypothetical protein B0A54_08766 [Friedmanniomyces endolithicus]
MAENTNAVTVSAPTALQATWYQYSWMLRYEAHYPPKLDETTLLNPADYTDLLPSDYAHELRCKRYEYEMRSSELAIIRDIKLTTCDEFLGSRNSSRENQPQSREPDFEGANRGLDYQLCPNEACGCPVYLGEACNHMTCQHHSCHTQFCFLCGEAVAHNAHHWAVGMPCPRYGRPGTATAIHDGEVIHGEVVGPAEGFADAVAEPENAPDEGMDDEEPDLWPP